MKIDADDPRVRALLRHAPVEEFVTVWEEQRLRDRQRVPRFGNPVRAYPLGAIKWGMTDSLQMREHNIRPTDIVRWTFVLANGVICSAEALEADALVRGAVRTGRDYRKVFDASEYTWQERGFAEDVAQALGLVIGHLNLEVPARPVPINPGPSALRRWWMRVRDYDV